VLQKNWMELIKPSKMDVNVQENDGRTGRLIAEPLERGFGLTLGNAIRRVLLSSLQGAAITSVKIKGVVHEFSTIPGVKEDLTDILLNLKSIAVKVHSPGLKKMYIKANGSGEIRAGNFETDSETEIMNKDQLIMTLDANADVEIEANIETGKGYVSAEVAEDENKIIGEIKLDAMFSPVVKATYKIENSRVGQVTDYDKLIFDVETNGVISPDDAIALSARILQDQLQAFINFDEPEIQNDQDSTDKLSFNSHLLKKVEELELSVRSANCLKNDNIIYIGDLVQKTEGEMLRTPNFGRKSLNEIKEVLTHMELNLGMSVPDWPPENIDDLAKKYEDPFNK
jgi:DNA-directed RNA polymerase subunit alpha